MNFHGFAPKSRKNMVFCYFWHSCEIFEHPQIFTNSGYKNSQRIYTTQGCLELVSKPIWRVQRNQNIDWKDILYLSRGLSDMCSYIGRQSPKCKKSLISFSDVIFADFPNFGKFCRQKIYITHNLVDIITIAIQGWK